MHAVEYCLLIVYNNNCIPFMMYTFSVPLRRIFTHPSCTMKGRIIIYSIIGCPHCLAAKNTLVELELPYTDVSLDKYPSKYRADVKQRTGKTSVPQIFFNEVYIGGNDDLQKLVKDKARLKTMRHMMEEHKPPTSAPTPPSPSELMESIDLTDVHCQPDEYARLVAEMKAAHLIKDHSKGLRSFKMSYSGAEFIDWIVNTKKLDEARALEMGQELINQRFGHTVKGEEKFTKDGFYRLLENDHSKALNGGEFSECAPLPPAELSEQIRKMILEVYAKFISVDGRVIDYAAMKSSPEFDKYTKLVKELQRVDIASADRNTKLAFFVNIYNALVVHATAVIGTPTNMWQRYKFFNTASYVIGGELYSLQDIENGVLRGNKKGVGMLFKSFGAKDPRASIALEKGEPMIHFALNCGAKSCPPIKTFSAKNVMEELQTATEAFLESDDGCTIVEEKKEVHISQIFKWYAEDFGGNAESTLKFVHEHMAEGAEKETLAKCLTGKVKYLPYDWGTNAKE